MTTDTRPLPKLHAGSPLAFIRDLAMMAICIGIVVSFLADVWTTRPAVDHVQRADVADTSRSA
jgi:hypothetical protein